MDNVIDISYAFYDCSSLTDLPDISVWNTINVKNASFLFYQCSKLENLPDISIWNIENFTDISYMFCYCSGLKDLPDITGWINPNNKTKHIFGGCNNNLNISTDDDDSNEEIWIKPS